MENLKEKIQSLATQLLDEQHFVVDVSIKKSKNKTAILILVDGDEGLNIEVCASLSRQIDDELDLLIEEAYLLEVSSPGADNPLKFKRQYPKHIGRTLAVELQDDTKTEGKLIDVTDTYIQLERTVKERGKKAIAEPFEVLFENIKSAKVLISFK
jgi:ribosome maturation factor RimP